MKVYIDICIYIYIYMFVHIPRDQRVLFTYLRTSFYFPLVQAIYNM